MGLAALAQSGTLSFHTHQRDGNFLPNPLCDQRDDSITVSPSRLLEEQLGLPFAGGPICLEGLRLPGVLIVLLIRKIQVRILAPQPSFQQVSLPGGGPEGATVS